MTDTRDEGHTERRGKGPPRVYGMDCGCGSLAQDGRMCEYHTNQRRYSGENDRRTPTSDTEDVGERTLQTVLAYMPSHWRDTLGENPQAIVGVTFQPDDAEEWVPVYIDRTPETEALRKAFVAGTKIGPCPGTEDLEFKAWLATRDPNAGGEDG